MQNPTKNNVRTFVRSLYNARLLEQTEAESVALESRKKLLLNVAFRRSL